MKFLLLLIGDDSAFDRATKEEVAEVVRRIGEFQERNGARITAGSPLARVAEARTTRVIDGRRTLIDGPYAETKESVAGYLILEAASVDEALRIAEEWPVLRGANSGVEVRQLMDECPLASA